MPQHLTQDDPKYNRMLIRLRRDDCDDLNRRSRVIREISAESTKRSSELRARSVALLEDVARRARVASLADME